MNRTHMHLLIAFLLGAVAVYAYEHKVKGAR